MPVFSGACSIIPCALCGQAKFKSVMECEGFSFVRCASCGLVQRNPQPDKNEIIARYTDTFGQDYLSYEIENEKAFLNLQQLAMHDADFPSVEEALFSKSAKTPAFLDVGCATGALLESLAKPRRHSSHGWHVTGVEISPCAEYAREKRKLDVKSRALEENEFAPRSFDVVHASHLVEHLNDPAGFMKEVFRILKDDGYFFLSTPNISGFQARLYRSRWRSAIFDHLYLFSRRTLIKMLKNTGFKIESCRTWGGLAAGMAPLWLKKTADSLAKRFNFGDVMIIRAVK